MEAQALSVLDGHARLLGGGHLRPRDTLGGQACLGWPRCLLRGLALLQNGGLPCWSSCLAALLHADAAAPANAPGAPFSVEGPAEVLTWKLTWRCINSLAAMQWSSTDTAAGRAPAEEPAAAWAALPGADAASPALETAVAVWRRVQLELSSDRSSTNHSSSESCCAGSSAMPEA